MSDVIRRHEWYYGVDSTARVTYFPLSRVVSVGVGEGHLVVELENGTKLDVREDNARMRMNLGVGE